MMMMIRNPARAGAGASSSSSSSSSSSYCCIRAGIIINKKKRSLPCRRGSCGSSSSLISPSSLRFGNGNGNGNGNGVGERGGSNLAFRRNVSSSSSSSSNWNRRPRFLLSSNSRTTTGLVGATAEIAEGGARRNEDNVISDCEPTNTSATNVFYLGALFGIWYLFNIYFSVYNKQVLNVYPFPLTISAFHFAIGTLFVLLMWTANLYRRPNISTSQLSTIVPLAVVHTMGNLFTNMSLGKVAVSFTHTIKAMEPFFTVVLSSLFLGEVPTIWVVASLVPIVGGVALASLTEASFNWAGLWSAMASNLTYQSRNVLSKKLMADKEESLDNITLFSIITIMSFFLSVPVALLVEGITFTPSYIQAAGLSVREIYTRSILAGLCFHAYQQVAYMILARVSPVSHSIGNCVKRVVIIVSSVLFFRTPVSPINSLGTGVALAGVFMYSRVKNIKAKAS